MHLGEAAKTSSYKFPLWEIRAEFAESLNYLMKLSEPLMMCAFMETNDKIGKRKEDEYEEDMLTTTRNARIRLR